MPFSKPYATPAQQINVLQARGMVFPDLNKANVCLERIGYYRLSAYWYPFREIDAQVAQGAPPARKDTFLPGTSFDDVIQFYVFDKELRIHLLDALERIEIALRANIADLLGNRDTWAHRETKELHGNFTTKQSSRNANLTKHQDWLVEQDRNFDRSREDFALHYRNKYQPPPPIWVAKEVWDWGMLSHFFSGMKYNDKSSISAIYSPQLLGDEFGSWIRAMNDVRNICAHHSRLWNRGLKVEPRLPKGAGISELNHIRGMTHSLNRVYGTLIVMIFLLKKLHPNTQWHTRLRDLVKSKAPTNAIIDVRSAGFPAGWDQQAIWS